VVGAPARAADDVGRAQVDRVVTDIRKNTAVQACFRRNAPRFRSGNITDPDALADLVSACAGVGRAFIAKECDSHDANCRVMTGMAMFFVAQEAVVKARAK
jgi:hypothetical protein